MSWKKLCSLALATVLLGTLVAGCGGGSTAKPAGKFLRYASGAEPETLDPRLMTGNPEGVVARQIYDTLTVMDGKNNIVPSNAERWEISPDGLKYTFYLRAGAKWSNGDPVTAADYEYAWKTALSPELGSKYAYQLYYLKNGEAYNTNKGKAEDVGVKAINDKTLEVTLEEPTPFFLSLVAFYTYSPVHKKTVEANPKWASDPKTIICNGPFKVANWTHNSKIEFAKNDQYWDAAKVKMDKMEFVLSDNQTTILSMFENGQVDLAENLCPVAEIPRMLKENKLQIFPYVGTYFYDFNVTKAPFNDPKVRKALSMAIDRETLIKNVTKAQQVPAMAWVPNGLPDVNPADDFRKKGGDFFKNNDVETAKKLLAEAGFPDGKGFPEMTLTYNTSENHKAIAEAIQEMWKKNLGIEAKLANQEWKVFLNTRRNLDYQVARDGWIGDYIDAMTFIDTFTSKSGNNNTGWKSPEYDALVKQAKSSMDPNVRMKAMHDAEKLLMDEAIIMPIYFYTSPVMAKPNVKGYVRNVLGMYLFKEAYVE